MSNPEENLSHLSFGQALAGILASCEVGSRLCVFLEKTRASSARLWL